MHTEVRRKYRESTIQREKQNAPSPYLEPNQSTKSTIDNDTSSIQCLAQSKKLYVKEDLSTCSDCFTFSNVFQFVSFQIVQNKHKRAVVHALFQFFPTKDPWELNRVGLLEKWTAQTRKRPAATKFVFLHNVTRCDQQNLLPFYTYNIHSSKTNLSFAADPKSISCPSPKLLPNQKNSTLIRVQGFQTTSSGNGSKPPSTRKE